MCGIIGANFPITSRILELMSHRGPDGKGFIEFKEGKYYLSLGHTRLAIIDLSTKANQPMKSIDESIWITYNGEIYNFQEIRSELENEFVFKTKSDTEVLINLYRKYSANMLEKLNGIFAFAIYDKRKNLLFIARDHIGIKPLYYWYDKRSTRFIFSSEIKAIKKLIDEITIDPKGIINYINFLYSPYPNTPFKNIKKLEPGSYIIFYLPTGKMEIRKWWDYKHFLLNKADITEIEAKSMLKNLLVETMSRQTVADVDIAFFLSGGIDSSLITTIYRNMHQHKEITAITAYSPEDPTEHGSSDIYFARMLAKELKVNLEEICIRPEITEDQLEEVIYFLDEPQGDPAIINTKLISKAARSLGFKVMISGTGGDDVFSGYRRHQMIYMYEKVRPIIRIIKLIRPILDAIPYTNKYVTTRRIKKLVDIVTSDNPITKSFLWIDIKTKELILHPEFFKENKDLIYEDTMATFLNDIPPTLNPIDKILYLESRGFLPDHNLNYMDKMGMSESVEIRVPYLDRELIEFAAGLPPELKIKNGQTKYILKSLSKDYLPNIIINRPKVGFGAPLRKWVREDLKPLLEKYLSSKHIEKYGIFNPSGVKKLIELNNSGKVDAAYNIYQILTMQIWCNINIP